MSVASDVCSVTDRQHFVWDGVQANLQCGTKMAHQTISTQHCVLSPKHKDPSAFGKQKQKTSGCQQDSRPCAQDVYCTEITLDVHHVCVCVFVRACVRACVCVGATRVISHTPRPRN